MVRYAIYANFQYNDGVIDARPTSIACPCDMDAYSHIVQRHDSTQESSTPVYRIGFIENHGVQLENDIEVHNALNLDSSRFLSAHSLSMSNGDVSIGGLWNSPASFKGERCNISIRPDTIAHFDSISGPIAKISNSGNLSIGNPSELTVDCLDNEGNIIGAESFGITVNNFKNNGVIVAKDQLHLVRQLKHGMQQNIRAEEAEQRRLGTILAGKTKVEVFIDHYLNTITHYYNVDQFGGRTFSHTTETGYIFQRREKHTEEKDLLLEEQQALHEIISQISATVQFLKGMVSALDKWERLLGKREYSDEVALDLLMLSRSFENADIKNLLLSSSAVYDALLLHRDASALTLHWLLQQGGGFTSAISGIRESLPTTPSVLRRSPSYSDLAHVDHVFVKFKKL